MQICLCRKCIVFQNLALYYATILKFEIYEFVCQNELFKLKPILIQVYAKKLSWKYHADVEITIDELVVGQQ